jgi:hypothetical protein
MLASRLTAMLNCTPTGRGFRQNWSGWPPGSRPDAVIPSKKSPALARGEPFSLGKSPAGALCGMVGKTAKRIRASPQEYFYQYSQLAGEFAVLSRVLGFTPYTFKLKLILIFLYITIKEQTILERNSTNWLCVTLINGG